MKNSLFAYLFRRYRLKSEFTTLSTFAEALVEEGIIFEDSLFSHWQTGDRIPKDRKTILALIRLFHKKQALQTLEEANTLMESVGLGYLTDDEKNILFIDTLQDTTIHSNNLLKTIEYSYSPLTLIKEQVDLCFEGTYLGYAPSTFNNLIKLTKVIHSLKLDKIKEGVNLLGHIYCMLLDCLYSQSGKNGLRKMLSVSDWPIFFAKENSTSELGYAYYIKFKIKQRLQLYEDMKGLINKNEVSTFTRLAELAIKNTPDYDIMNRSRTHYVRTKLALLLKNRYLFDKHLFSTFNLFDKLPRNMQYLRVYPLVIKALGEIRFYNNTLKSLEFIQSAEKYLLKKYQRIYLFYQVSKLQILRSSKDYQYRTRAYTLDKEIKIQNAVLGNDFENMRMREKRMIGLT